ALNNIINAGTISSAGNLSLAAGGAIMNSGSGGSSPLIQSLRNLNLSAPNIMNQGLISSLAGSIDTNVAAMTNGGICREAAGNVSVSSFNGHSLSIINPSGLISAAQKISLATLSQSSSVDASQDLPKASLSVSGGTLSAPEIGISSPNGQMNIHP